MEIAWPEYLLCGAGGVLLGMFYFGSLWWVVRRLPDIQRPGLWVPLSTLARTLAVLAGMYFLIGQDWIRLLAAMAGFVLGRLIVFRQVGIDQQRS